MGEGVSVEDSFSLSVPWPVLCTWLYALGAELVQTDLMDSLALWFLVGFTSGGSAGNWRREESVWDIQSLNSVC